MKKFLSVILIIVMFSSCSYGAAKKKGNKSAKVDLDLTKFSSVMVYSALFNVLTNPSAYIGQTIKIKGQFDFFHDEDTDKNYFGVMVMDASACCSTGIDFVLKKNYNYPSDYPEVGEVITVAGKFEQYQEDGITYCHLVEADIL